MLTCTLGYAADGPAASPACAVKAFFCRNERRVPYWQSKPPATQR